MQAEFKNLWNNDTEEERVQTPIHISAAAGEIYVGLKASMLWGHVKNLKLTTNMLVALQNDMLAELFQRHY